MPKIPKMADQFKICVSGSAVDNCLPGAFKKTEEVGYQIAKQGAVLLTGATIGIPESATKGAKRGKGMSIGFSPAATRREHTNTYRLPTKYMDLIIYTGADYSGRNLILTRSADAVIEVCGRIGTLNEFTIAFEDHKPIGILVGTGGISDQLKHILEVGKRGQKNIIFDEDPARLVKRLLALLKKLEKSDKRFTRPQMKISLE